MPTYQYQCDACGHQFEVYQLMTAEKLKDCPQCNRAELYRLIGTGGGIIFKGSGFYETDYKRKDSDSTGSSDTTKSAPKESPASSS